MIEQWQSKACTSREGTRNKKGKESREKERGEENRREDFVCTNFPISLYLNLKTRIDTIDRGSENQQIY